MSVLYNIISSQVVVHGNCIYNYEFLLIIRKNNVVYVNNLLLRNLKKQQQSTINKVSLSLPTMSLFVLYVYYFFIDTNH